MPGKPEVVAPEEHFQIHELGNLYGPVDANTAPGLQKMDAETAVRLAPVVDAYYQDMVAEWPGILRAAWGFTVETATQGVRLCLSGVFDKYPKLRLIMGHLGEGLPFLMWRINMALNRQGSDKKQFRDVFSEHFTITTSGFWSDPALLLCVQEMGIDRIMHQTVMPANAGIHDFGGPEQ